MNKNEFEEKTEEFERKFKKYQAYFKPIPGCIETGEFRVAALLLRLAEGSFSDGLLEELHYLAGESENIDPPESEIDIIKDSDGYRVGE